MVLIICLQVEEVSQNRFQCRTNFFPGDVDSDGDGLSDAVDDDDDNDGILDDHDDDDDGDGILDNDEDDDGDGIENDGKFEF